jgi:hypothetical protein
VSLIGHFKPILDLFGFSTGHPLACSWSVVSASSRMGPNSAEPQHHGDPAGSNTVPPVHAGRVLRRLRLTASPSPSASELARAIDATPKTITRGERSAQIVTSNTKLLPWLRELGVSYSTFIRLVAVGWDGASLDHRRAELLDEMLLASGEDLRAVQHLLEERRRASQPIPVPSTHTVSKFSGITENPPPPASLKARRLPGA